jgi:hypothetical protein
MSPVGKWMIALGAAILVFQGYWWLREAHWLAITPLRVWQLLGGSTPRLEWEGLEHLVRMALAVPLGVLLFVLGFAIDYAVRRAIQR